MNSSSKNTADSVLDSNGEFELRLNQFEQNLERVYHIWENSIQGFRNAFDIRRFLDIFYLDRNFFEAEFNKNKQCLTRLKCEIDIKLYENTERLKYLQKQQFTSNEEKQLAIIQQTQQLNFIKLRRTNVEHEKTKLKKIYKKFCAKVDETFDNILNIALNLQQEDENDVQSKGLNPKTIKAFKIFTADESHVGDQCSICMEDIDVGRIMRRLTCDGQHYFCQQCIEGWFADHNTCPLCRHKFD